MTRVDGRYRVANMAAEDACPPGCVGLHSYTSDGRRWCLLDVDPHRHALDVELQGDPPDAIARRLPDRRDFWLDWTTLEVVAKLTDTPVVTLLGQGALGQPAPLGIETSHLATKEFTMCVGRKQ